MTSGLRMTAGSFLVKLTQRCLDSLYHPQSLFDAPFTAYGAHFIYLYFYFSKRKGRISELCVPHRKYHVLCCSSFKYRKINGVIVWKGGEVTESPMPFPLWTTESYIQSLFNMIIFLSQTILNLTRTDGTSIFEIIQWSVLPKARMWVSRVDTLSIWSLLIFCHYTF